MKNLFVFLSRPFTIIIESKSDYVIWFLFTIITGQFGILANFIVRHYAHNTSLSSSIYIESMNGSFYTFAIALIASLLGPVFLNFIKSDRIQFRTLKTFTIIVAIFFLFVAAIIYASLQSRASNYYDFESLEIDYTQTVIYLFAIVFTSYGYCVLRLEDSALNFTDLNDPFFPQQNNEHVADILVAEPFLNQDPNGIAL